VADLEENLGKDKLLAMGSVKERQNRAQVGRIILLATLWLTLLVLSIKILAAWTTRSLSLMAESLHTLITSFSILLSLLKGTFPDRPRGLSISGHGKRETLVTFLLIALLSFVGFNLLILSGQQLAADPRGVMLTIPVRVSLPLIKLLGAVGVTSLGLGLICFYQAKILINSALRFNGKQLLKDFWLTLLVLIGLLGVGWGLVWLDVVLAILLVLLTATNCWKVLIWQLPLLVQQTAIAPEVLAQIARQVGGVTHCYHIQSRGIVGRLVYVQMHLILHPEFSEATSLIAQQIEGLIRERYGPVQVTFYIDDDLTLKNSEVRVPESE